MEASKKKSPSPIAWVLGQAGSHGEQFALSVILAVLGVAFSVAPYFAVVGIVKGLMAGERNLSYYLIQAGLIGWGGCCATPFPRPPATGRPSPCWARSASAAPRS